MCVRVVFFLPLLETQDLGFKRCLKIGDQDVCVCDCVCDCVCVFAGGVRWLFRHFDEFRGWRLPGSQGRGEELR